MRIFWRLHRLALGAFLLAGSHSSALAQQPILPASLNSLSGESLRSELARLKNLTAPAVRQLAETVAPQASDLLAAPDQLSESLAADIAAAARMRLSPDGLAALTRQLQGSAAPTASFRALQASYAALKELNLPSSDLAKLASSWAAERDIKVLTRDELAWLVPRVQSSSIDPANFDVIWQGTITAPQSGAYTFSTTPIRSGYLQSDQLFAEQAFTVAVDGQEVVRASTQGWNWKGAPLELTADKPAQIEVRLSYRSAGIDPQKYPATAFLFWEGPASPRQLVPNSALSSSLGRGLAATYKSAAGAPQEPLLELGVLLVGGPASHPGAASDELTQSLRDAYFASSMAPDYLAAVRTGATAAASHPFLAVPETAVATLTTEQQAAWLSELKASPDIVNGLSIDGISRNYLAWRFSAPDDAYNLLTHWMKANRHAASPFTNWFARDVRQVYFDLADRMLWEYPEHAQTWNDSCLYEADGGCSLPASYVMAFLSALRGQMDIWKAEVDRRLDGGNLVSDTRAEWLIARAVAREVQYTATDRYEAPSVFPAWAESSLAEAVQAAASPALRAVAYRELIARFAAQREYDYADKLIVDAQKSLGPSFGEQIAAWQAASRDLRTAHKLDAELQEVARLMVLKDATQEQIEIANRVNRPDAARVYELQKQQLTELPNSAR